MNEIDKKLLTRVYQDAKTGIVASNEVLDKCQDIVLKQLISNQKDLYEDTAKKCENFAQEHKTILKDNNAFKKFKQIAMINMTLFFKENDRKIAEMMLTGTLMGIIDAIKSLYDLNKADSYIFALGEDLQRMQEKYLEELKKYLQGNSRPSPKRTTTKKSSQN